MKFLLKVPLRLVTTAPPTVHPVLLSYAGAAGLAGLGLIGALMLTPAGQVVTQVVEPAREAVQAIIPMPLPRVFGLQPPLSKLPLPARPVSLIPANDATIALANDAQDAQDTLPPLNVAAPLAMPQSLAQPVVSKRHGGAGRRNRATANRLVGACRRFPHAVGSRAGYRSASHDTHVRECGSSATSTQRSGPDA